MLLGYVRPDPRHSEVSQTKALLVYGVSEGKIYVEEKRQRGDSYPSRDALVRSIRAKAQDVVVVSEFHRLASDGESLKLVVRAIRKRKGEIVEAMTGRRSDCQADLADMVLEATEVYANRGLSKEAASRLAQLGAAASPVTKPKTGHMPLHEIAAIMNDHTLDVIAAHAKIRRDRRYKFAPSLNTIYRWAKSGKIKLLPRLSGRKPKAR